MHNSRFGRADTFTRGKFHLNGKGAAVFADGRLRKVDSGVGSILCLEVPPQFEFGLVQSWAQVIFLQVQVILK